MRYFAKLSYVGTAYNGWQVQENTPRTVQQVLNESISRLLNEKIEFTGCGRTDTGVHAAEFYAHFDSQKDLSDPESVYKFNSVVPRDIAVQELLRVKDAAHARYDAISRSYRYQIIQQRNPFFNERAAFLYAPLDIDRMNEAAKALFDYSDFTSFSKLRTQVKTNLCKVMRAEWSREGELLVFRITADRFLRNMVRAIVGTLVRVGKKEINADDVRRIIESRDRGNAGESFPAHGLYLEKVVYPAELFLNE
ncbi:MAG: tRNA pseudouridine(38-40) synthase TruA [Bacteroidota bacterium]